MKRQAEVSWIPQNYRPFCQGRFVLLLFALLAAEMASGLELAVPAIGGDSHPALRTPPPAAERPLADGPVLFVDPNGGDDSADGSRERPLQTAMAGISRLRPGMTLCLRGGTYFEPLTISAQGSEEAPVTIRAFPGETVIIDGGLREFVESPETAWEPCPDSVPGEFRSTQAWPNLRTVVGSFGDSQVGLNTYWYRDDLRSSLETVTHLDPARARETDILPLWCGPGLWYDAASGYIHARLAHTHVQGVSNYQGETDPRRLPLVIAALRSVPLRLDGARHVRIFDVTIRGAGHDAVVLDQCENIHLENVTIWCGTYGLRASGTVGLKLLGCGLYGNCPPWLFRSDTSKRAYPGRPFRDITRLNTHALLVPDAGREFSVFAHPMNDDWEIAYCDFADAHDGVYLGGVNTSFHHNLLDATQDDGVYLSQMYPRHLYMGNGAEVRLFQNVFRGCLTALAFGGPEDTRDQLYVYRNVFDLTQPVPTGRPTAERPDITMSTGKLMGDHGSPPWPTMTLYHNTVIAGGARRGSMESLQGTRLEHPRRVFNNIFLHTDRLPAFAPPTRDHSVLADGNLYWAPGTAQAVADGYFQRYRNSPDFAAIAERAPNGVSRQSRVADPGLETGPRMNDATRFSLRPGSAATGTGVALPEELPDPLRIPSGTRPDAGAVPFGREFPSVGRAGYSVPRP